MRNWSFHGRTSSLRCAKCGWNIEEPNRDYLESRILTKMSRTDPYAWTLMDTTNMYNRLNYL